MSRGIGRGQALLLRALLSIRASHAGRKCFVSATWAGWRISFILNRVWELSPDLQERYRLEQEASAKRRREMLASMEEKAAAGNELAREFLMLDRVLSFRSGRTHPRTYRDAHSGLIERTINPSRALAALERRGLVKRWAVQGGGSADLTAAGVNAARREIMKRLSVGSSWPSFRGGQP